MAVLFLLAGIAFGDWPMARHDARRTALATGTSDIVQPVAYWKRYVGGRLAADAFMMADVDGEIGDEVLMIAGGRAVARRRTDAEVWASPNLALVAFVGLEDVDGDGQDDLLVRSADRVHAIDPQRGTLRWSQPAGEIGTIGAARLGDLDGDGLSDLVVQECVCCLVPGTTPGFALSFAGGIDAPTRLWDFPVAHCTGGAGVTLVDVAGNGSADVLFGDEGELVLLDGQTGAELARSPTIGTWTQQSRCVAADIDRTGGEEMVCVLDVDREPTVNRRKVFALRRQGGLLAIVWSRNLAPVQGGALSWVELVSDLEGDRRPEVVVSALEDGAWSTYVFAADSGARRGLIPDEIAMGVAPGPDGAVLLTSATGHLSGWRLDGELSLDWTILDAVVPAAFDPARAARAPIDQRATVADVDGDGAPDLVTALRSDPRTIVGYRLAGGDVSELARFDLPPDVHLQRAWILTAISDGDLELAVTGSNGVLTLLGQGLVPVHDGSDDVSYAELTTGGYYAPGWVNHENSPRSARLGDGGPERILLRDSRGSLVALDAALGAFVAPPAILWDVVGATAPSVVPGLDGDDPGVACLVTDQPETTPPTYSLLALDGAGQTLWRQPAPESPLNDPVPGNFDGDGTPDLVYQWGDPGDVLIRTRAVSGADGSTLWESSPIVPGGSRHPRGVAVGRFDGDALDDVYHQAGLTEVLSGADGSRLAASEDGPSYGMPVLTDLDEDGLSEVVVQGSLRPLQVLDHDLEDLLYQSSDNNRPLPYGATADCGDGRLVLVQGSVEFPARLKLTDLSGPGAGDERTLVLAGGALWADEASAGAALGQLNAATVHQDLTGEGRPSALVGSTDGWLYAVDPCGGELDWSYEFGAAVGEATFGDTDGDGRDEVLVTAQDGYLYNLRDFEIAAPEAVLDTDPFSAQGGDLQELITISTLEATWSPVSGAARYEVALVDQGGHYIGEPWRDAGTATTLLLDDLPLEDGTTYRFGVRAIAAHGGHSVDTVSNGIWVHLPVGADDAPGDGGCGCRSAAGPSPAASAVLVLLVAALLRRRRRSR